MFLSTNGAFCVVFLLSLWVPDIQAQGSCQSQALAYEGQINRKNPERSCRGSICFYEFSGSSKIDEDCENVGGQRSFPALANGFCNEPDDSNVTFGVQVLNARVCIPTDCDPEDLQPYLGLFQQVIVNGVKESSRNCDELTLQSIGDFEAPFSSSLLHFNGHTLFFAMMMAMFNAMLLFW